jgi:hypothetical protein
MEEDVGGARARPHRGPLRDLRRWVHACHLWKVRADLYTAPVTEELLPEVDPWARAHGFAPSADQIGDPTPLLRLGEFGTTDDAYRGEIAGHDAILAEYSIGSPNLSAEFGGDGMSTQGFTLFLVMLDASAWPRLTVRPSTYPDHDFFKRVLHRDHRVQTVSPEMDERYRVIAATGIPDAQLAALFSPELVAWWLAQSPEISVDIEDHGEYGGYLSVAHAGFGIGDAALDQLLEQTTRLVAAFTAA